MSASNGFVVVRKRRFEWVDYPTEPVTDAEGNVTWIPDADFAGFKTRLYANATMEEVRHEAKLWEQLRAEDISEWDYLTEFAERVVDWNFHAETVEGQTAKVPPPAEDPKSFYLLTPGVMYWVLGVMRIAHFPKDQEGTEPTPSPSPGTTATSTRTKTTRGATRQAASGKR